MGQTGPRWAPCWPHELCYLGWLMKALQNDDLRIGKLIQKSGYASTKSVYKHAFRDHSFECIIENWNPILWIRNGIGTIQYQCWSAIIVFYGIKVRLGYPSHIFWHLYSMTNPWNSMKCLSLFLQKVLFYHQQQKKPTMISQISKICWRLGLKNNTTNIISSHRNVNIKSHYTHTSKHITYDTHQRFAIPVEINSGQPGIQLNNEDIIYCVVLRHHVKQSRNELWNMEEDKTAGGDFIFSTILYAEISSIDQIYQIYQMFHLDKNMIFVTRRCQKFSIVNKIPMSRQVNSFQCHFAFSLRIVCAYQGQIKWYH